MKSKPNYIKTNFGLKDYHAFPDRIEFIVRTGKKREVFVPKALKHFTKFNQLYLKINGKVKICKINTYKDRKYIVHRAYVGKNITGIVYLKTKKQFSKIIDKAIGSEENIICKYKDNIRLNLNSEGKLLLKFLVPSSNRDKSFHSFHNILKGRCASITVENLKKMVNDIGLNPKMLTPFLENYFVDKVKRDLIFPKENVGLPKEVFRSIGLVNGDGHIDCDKVYFYGHNLKLHEDFKRGIFSLFPKVNFKFCKNLPSNIPTSYAYGRKIPKKLIESGCLQGNKVSNKRKIFLPNNFHAISEYVSGFFDAEGSLIKYSNLVIASCTSIVNDNFRVITKKQNEMVKLVAREHGRKYKMPHHNLNYYHIGLRILLKVDKKGTILKKIKKEIPPLIKTAYEGLKSLGITSKMELRSLTYIPHKGIINAVWWVKLTPIKEVIKFAICTNPRSGHKNKRIENFLHKHLTLDDYQKLKDFIKENTI